MWTLLLILILRDLDKTKSTNGNKITLIWEEMRMPNKHLRLKRIKRNRPNNSLLQIRKIKHQEFNNYQLLTKSNLLRNSNRISKEIQAQRANQMLTPSKPSSKLLRIRIKLLPNRNKINLAIKMFKILLIHSLK